MQIIKSFIAQFGNRIASISTSILFWSIFILISVIAYDYMSRKEHQLTELPTPNTGALVRYDNPLDPSNYGIVRFVNNTYKHIYIRINVLPTHKPHLTLFIRKSQIIRLHIPFDRYQIQVAQGDQWFGEWDEALFGKDTLRYQLIEPLVLKRSESKELKNLSIAELINSKELKEITRF